MKKDKRGSYWKNIPAEEISIRMSYVTMCKHRKTTKEEKRRHSIKMNKARWNK